MIGKTTKRQYNMVGKTTKRQYNVDNSIWLWKSGVALPTINTTEPTVPLKMNEKSSLFKLFLSDIGLLTTMYGKSTKLKIVQRDAAVNNGSVFENNIHYLPIYMIMFISDNDISFPKFDLKF